MNNDNEKEKPPVFLTALEIMAQIRSEDIEPHLQLKRFKELENGSKNLSLVSAEYYPKTRVQLMEVLQRKFNLNPDSRLLAYLFDNYSKGLPLR